MTVYISRSVLAAIRAEAAADPGREICGLLLGEGAQVTQARHAANWAPDPARHFEIDPATLIAAHRDARGGGPALLGHYHSHPRGIAVPSLTDARDAAPDGSLWLIIAGGDVAAWRAGQGGLHGRFVAERLDVFDEPALASPAAGRQ